jgi:alcohol dehydrogenase class IV
VAVSPFTFTDGERLIRFGAGVLHEAPALLAERGFDEYVLLTTERARTAAPALVEGAASVLHVPDGGVPEAAAAVRDGVGGRPMVALGGGRVVDSAKAIAGADGLSCAAVPTTLAGSPFTPFHRMPTGVEDWRLVRPSLVVADPALMASAPAPQLVATGMNALAHAMEALYTPRANPVAELAALRAAALLGAELPRVGRGEGSAELALGAVLGGYAVGTTGLALHHAVCQTIVRTCGTPHAETNAVMLPHSARFMAGRAPREMAEFARALRGESVGPAAAGDLVAALTALSGTTRLSQLGVTESAMEEVASAAAQHPAVQATPGGGVVGREELKELLRRAL